MNDQETTISNSLSQEQYSGKKVKPGKKPPGASRKTTSLLFLVLIWAVLVFGGFYLAKGYLHKTEGRFLGQVEELRQENRRIEKEIVGTMQLFQNELESYKEEIRLLRGEMSLIQEELELTGESITGADQTRQSLQERMAALDRQLAALREQLQKLEQAVRVL